MTDNQRAKNVFNLMYKGELPEKTIQEQIESEALKRHPYVWPKNKDGEEIVQRVGQNPPGSAKAKKTQQQFCRAAEFGYSLAQTELSSKDKLIETTHNNLLAALEENKKLKLVLRNVLAKGTGHIAETDQRWIEFCKETNINP